MDYIMTDLTKTLANLVKTNNGLFKSDAQAQFVRSIAGDEYGSGGNVYGNSYSLHYMLDSTGVVSVHKNTVAKGLVLVWERVTAGVESVQDAKEIKRLKRLIKSIQKSMDDRQASWDSGEYIAHRNSPASLAGAKMLFSARQSVEQETLNAAKKALAALQN